jgi:hypothetical protein
VIIDVQGKVAGLLGFSLEDGKDPQEGQEIGLSQETVVTSTPYVSLLALT